MRELAHINTYICDAYDCTGKLLIGGEPEMADVEVINKGWSLDHIIPGKIFCPDCSKLLKEFLYGE